MAKAKLEYPIMAYRGEQRSNWKRCETRSSRPRGDITSIMLRLPLIVSCHLKRTSFPLSRQLDGPDSLNRWTPCSWKGLRAHIVRQSSTYRRGTRREKKTAMATLFPREEQRARMESDDGGEVDRGDKVLNPDWPQSSLPRPQIPPPQTSTSLHQTSSFSPPFSLNSHAL